MYNVNTTCVIYTLHYFKRKVNPACENINNKKASEEALSGTEFRLNSLDIMPFGEV